MPAYAQTTRTLASALSDAADWASDATTTIGLGYVAVGNGTGGAYLIFVGGFFKFLRRTARAIADDPPNDQEFRTPTRARAHRARLEHLFPSDDLERAAFVTAVGTDDADVELSAHLRAFERYQGAALREAAKEASARAGESRRYARLASSGLRHAADGLDGLRDVLAREPLDAMRSKASYRSRPEELPKDTLALLYTGGLRIQELERLLSERKGGWGPDLQDVLRSAAKSEREFADHLEVWEPPDAAALLRSLHA